MDEKYRKSLKAVLDYMWDDEAENAEDIFRENGDIDGHVFVELVNLKNFLEDTNIDPVDFLDLSDCDDDDDDDDDADADEEWKVRPHIPECMCPKCSIMRGASNVG